MLAGRCELRQDVTADLSRIATPIRVDSPGLRVVRTGNRPTFGGDRRICSVDEAVNRVGCGAMLRFVGSASVAGVVACVLTR